MESCIGCKWADWKKTKNGRLHPSGDGKCMFQYELPQLPASMYWLGTSVPKPFGGHLDRNRKPKDCPYYCEEGANDGQM